MSRQPFSVWPAFLPNVAHLAGCLGATAFCVSMPPFSGGPVVWTGLGFTLVTYLIQFMIRMSRQVDWSCVVPHN